MILLPCFRRSVCLLLTCVFTVGVVPSANGQQEIVRTPEGIFSTRETPSALPLPNDEDAFQFIIYGDRTGGDRSGLKVLEQAVVDTNLLDPDFVLTVGDLIQGYGLPEPWLEEAKEFKQIMSGLTMPWFPVAGNHDIYWDFNDQDRPVFQHEKNYEENFGPLWYSFQHKDTGFIMLYTDEGDLETGEKGFNKGRLQNMSADQIEFLKQALEKYNDLPKVFVALHHPRWTGGGYAGSNWPEIHKMLVAAGNVKAVFAGHIHKMRFDPQDGIDYYALATTGGHLSADLPEVGYLHHYNVVTVRPESYSMATIPVGAVIDPKDFAPEFLTDVELVRRMRPRRVSKAVPLSNLGGTAHSYSVGLTNPGKFPIDVAMTPHVSAGWSVVPDHQHIVIAPGKTSGMDFYFYRSGESENGNEDPWFGFANPSLEMAVDYLHESARIQLTEVAVPVDTGVAELDRGEFEMDLGKCLVLGGTQANTTRQEIVDIQTDCGRVNSADLDLPQGPFTLEAWINPTANDGSRAVIAKTQSSEYAIFLSNGRPLFDVYLGDGYVTAASEDILPLNEWSHIAGVYDGENVRLFINGKLIVSTRSDGGERKKNNLPLYIGADPDGTGSPTRQFAGKMDEVRLSTGVRYASEFTPAIRHESDESTKLLLHLDRVAGPFLYDASPQPKSVLRYGAAAIGER